ncbi:hypothetical protein [uncultured Adlercreutzia sp.]|uniref:hypothetical protein n=1 Tax=uncultured Adlercreutzia sp. TaxID=875803 RepID=UPI0025CDDE26|nr:hypothetical protein [uncultured Adlercreutzia sp.]
MGYVKLNNRVSTQKILSGAAALLLALAVMVALPGCGGGQSDEDVIRASLSQELDSIKNIDDSFVNEFSESINMSQLSVYGIDGVEFMKAYLDGFDYTIDSIEVNGDTAQAQITLTCKSYTAYAQALQDAVNEITSDPEKIASVNGSDSEINDMVGGIVIDSLNGVDLATTEPIIINYTKVDNTWEPASSTSGDIAAALMTN